MVFSDLLFLFVFLPTFMIAYLFAAVADKKILTDGGNSGNSVRNAVLVMFSLLFYAWGEPVYVFLMLGCVLVNYIVGLAVDRWSNHRKAALALGVACNIAILGTFKYLSFVAQSLAAVGISVPDPKITLPIGISFYVFQSISYLVDVYRRDVPVQRRFCDLLLYISMFPQLIAGPIVRYNTVAREIGCRTVSGRDFADGTYRFLIGLGKKVILANQLSEISSQFLDGSLESLSVYGAWIGIVAFTLQIYFDFSGYSDMAIGIGRCLGFHFNENFNHPYCCTTVTDFWRRWHMSLGSFFRDYVYIPLGGNRRHQAANILVVWFLTGMWHGASWNFIIWGVYFGLIVMVEKYTVLRVRRWVPSPLLHVYSMLLVIVGWGIFYFDDFQRMVAFFNKAFGAVPSDFDFVAESTLTGNFWLWITAVALCMPVRRCVSGVARRCVSDSGAFYGCVEFVGRFALSAVILVLSVALLVGATNNAFIYTRF